ncbi:MAG: FAD-dependent oxidoreductase [Gammaproteobacteria bacterium]
MNRNRLFLLALVVALIVAWFGLGLDRYLSFDAIRSQRQVLEGFVSENRALAIGAYFSAYVLITALSIPGAVVMTLLGGALFGVVAGSIVVSFASTIGATLAFLVSRFLFRQSVERRFAGTVERINEGIRKDGPYYLFTLRLVPIFPFFAINLAMGLTRIRATTFAWVSQLGMLPGTIVYVNAGTQLGRIDDPGDIASPAIIGSFALLGLFPLIAKKLTELISTRQRMKDFDKPRRFDRNLVVIGAGSAGLVTSYVAAAAKARVTLIERDRMGGDCLNTGCVPSKALIRSAKIASYLKRADEFGLIAGDVSVDFQKVMARVRRVIDTIEPHDSVERYSALGVDCVAGEARIESPWHVRVGDRTLSTRNIVIATGGSPFIPPIPGIDSVDPLTSDTVWELDALPKRLLVLGGGPIGCELAQAFGRLGSEVTLVEMAPRLLFREDAEVSTALEESFAAEGIRVLLAHRAVTFEDRGGKRTLVCKPVDGEEVDTLELVFDSVLVATGRRAATADLGLEKLGIETNRNGTVAVNDFLQTNWPNVFACGDAAGPYQLTHAAGHQGWYCAMNALFGRFWKFRVDYSALPWAVFTDPEVARVGITEAEAEDQGLDFEVTRYGIDDLDRAIADGEARGFVKVITPAGQDRILGVTIVGAHAGDLIAEFVSGMRNGFGLKKILGTIHIYPTLAEANKYAAGAWQREQLSPRLLSISERFNTWMRG